MYVGHLEQQSEEFLMVTHQHTHAAAELLDDLEPDRSTVPPIHVEYTCPMHSEIVRDRSGACPICGMGLES